jgi:hypothetical protein
MVIVHAKHDALLRKGCEGRFEVAIGSGIPNNELQAQRARRRPQVCNDGRGSRGRLDYNNGPLYPRTRRAAAASTL